MCVNVCVVFTGSEAEQLDLTPPPDYDYNATFEYSFFSTSHATLNAEFRFGRLSERCVDVSR